MQIHICGLNFVTGILTTNYDTPQKLPAMQAICHIVKYWECFPLLHVVVASKHHAPHIETITFIHAGNVWQTYMYVATTIIKTTNHLKNHLVWYCRSMMALLFVLTVLTASLDMYYAQSLSLGGYSRHLYVDGIHGDDSEKCLINSSFACQSLSFISQNLTETSSITIEIMGEILNVTEHVDFNKNYTNLTIKGMEGKVTLYCSEFDAGLAFMAVRNLTIYSLAIENCGARRNSTSVNPPSPDVTELLNVAVYILNCTNVTIDHIHVKSSNGTGLSVYDTNGIVDIVNCNFTKNGRSKGPGGGGIHIEFTFCSPGTVRNCSGHHGQNCNSNYTITNCIFSDNLAYSLYHSFIPPSHDGAIPKTGRGGGLYISINSDATNNSFIVQYCNFVNNSASYVAGGMLVEILDSVQNNSISVSNTRFVENNCVQTNISTGGGLVFAAILYTKSHVDGILPINNLFSCNDCLFKKNSANKTGGGTGLYATKDFRRSSQLTRIIFTRCNWTENVSPMGAAIFITPAIWDYATEGFLPVPQFIDSRIDSNSAMQKLPQFGKGVYVSSSGYGALFSIELRLNFEGNTYFYGNQGSAIVLSDSVLEFGEECITTFYNNTAFAGGAILMHGSSVIQFRSKSFFNFTRNRAYSRGGAINSKGAFQPSYHSCFLQSTKPHYNRINSTFLFRENKAEITGHSIFTSTFHPCEMFCSDIDQSDKYPENTLQCIANFSFGESNDSQLATLPEKFVIDAAAPVKLIPGLEYHLPLSVKDEANSTLFGIVYEAKTASNTTVYVDRAFSQVSNNTIALLGAANDRAKLHLRTANVVLSIDITLTDCQPGYHMNRNGLKCECAASEYMGLVGCDPGVYLKSGYWMGNCSHDKKWLRTAPCPYGFCFYNHVNPNSDWLLLPNSSDQLDPIICGERRTGRLCGHCSTNYSVHFNSWKFTCGRESFCHLGWLFYLLSEIIPATILFLIILAFNISFTSGNVNCFILYAQLLDALAISNGTLELPCVTEWIQRIVIFLYQPLNLNFFNIEELSYCMWKGATVMDVLLMKYVTVAFSLVLVVMTIIIARYSRCANMAIFSRFPTRNSVLIHGLSAFFVLCYSQSARVTFHIMNISCLYSSKFICREWVVTYSGNMIYFDENHKRYAIIAMFVAVFMVTIHPLLLLIYPLVFKLLGLCKLSESKLAVILWRVMPIQILDAFQSSFKDEYRFFAGLYFLYRAVILGTSVCSLTLLQFYSIIQIELVLVLSVHAIIQPHKERRHNRIETLIFTNLVIINAVTLFNHSRNEYLGQYRNEAETIVVTMIQAMLIILPLFCVIIIGIVRWKWKKFYRGSDDSTDLPPLRSSEHQPLIM